MQLICVRSGHRNSQGVPKQESCLSSQGQLSGRENGLVSTNASKQLDDVRDDSDWSHTFPPGACFCAQIPLGAGGSTMKVHRASQVPDQPGYNRGVVLPSGWFLQAADGGGTRLNYLLQESLLGLAWTHLGLLALSVLSVCAPLVRSPCG